MTIKLTEQQYLTLKKKWVDDLTDTLPLYAFGNLIKLNRDTGRLPAFDIKQLNEIYKINHRSRNESPLTFKQRVKDQLGIDLSVEHVRWLRQGNQEVSDHQNYLLSDKDIVSASISGPSTNNAHFIYIQHIAEQAVSKLDEYITNGLSEANIIALKLYIDKEVEKRRG